MNTRILFVGLEVDDKAFHACLSAQFGDEEFEVSCKPSVSALIKKLEKYREQGWELKICYEATYLGFSVCRDLRKAGLQCNVVAPALIPETPGPRVKTDKLDSRKLAKYYKANLLTMIHVPEIEDEVIRDLLRSRAFLAEKLKSTKSHIISLCRRMGLNYREVTGQKNYWTAKHVQWLRSEISKTKSHALQFNLHSLLSHSEQILEQIKTYDGEIGAFSQIPRLQKKVAALICYRGIDKITAMTIATELGDTNRFSHPKRLVSFAGMDISEYSSGGHEKKFRITKMGNPFVRTAVIEASQHAFRKPGISRALRQRRENADPKFVDIADRCMNRLYRKSTRLLFAGKIRNKVKVAAAREMLGFIWESMRTAA